MLCHFWNFRSQLFEALKLSSPTSFATSRVFSWSNGPETGILYERALQNYSNLTLSTSVFFR